MQNIITLIKQRLTDLMWIFIANGLFLLIMAVVVVWDTFLVRLLIGLIILLIAYSLFYVAYKIHSIRKMIE
ncbi:MAG: hypothetical protein QY321_03885 [Patescibacteria group bacterium]|nr:MAG: hypothetical protein QY321_03885 [Patescibacteria group bacterium]